MEFTRKLLTLIFIVQTLGISAQMIQINEFGTNPGNLDMFLFEPSDPKTDAEVVLVLHGCGQNISNFAEQTGWNVLAEHYGFYVVFAQQKAINNPSKCFNWFLSSDNTRENGEAKSLAEMVNYVHDNYATDHSKSFVCGLSAGGSMTPVMMACYPDIFKSGGVWAGVPYLYQPSGNNNISPSEWGDKARSAYPTFSGKYPTLFICQGTEDPITEPINETRLIAQWTDIHHSDQIPDHTNTPFNGNPDIEENIYLNASQDPIVKSYKVTGMRHGIAVDPGNEPHQGGQTSIGSFDVNFYSTYWMADFFGIIDNDVVNSIEETNTSDVEVLMLRDGSLKIVNNTQSDPLQILVYDIFGRTILKEALDKENVFFPNQFNGERIIAVSIVNKTNQQVFSKLFIR